MTPRICLILITQLFVLQALRSQETHVCEPEKCFRGYFVLEPFSSRPDTVIIDTTIKRFFITDLFTNELFLPAFTGTSGHPAFDLFKRFRIQGLEYFYHNPYNNYQLNPDNLRIIRSDVPFSEWYYLVGARSEQIFRATHALNAGRNFNFGVDLKYINSRGAYYHEHAKASYAGFYAQYRDPFLPFESDMAVFFNSATTEENGGISEPGWFEDNNFINRQLIPVWSTTAQSNHRKTEILLRNRWYLGRKGSNVKGEGAHVKGDTTEAIGKFRTLEHHLSLSFGLKSGWFLYRDTDPLNQWYDIVRYDSTLTNDSISFRSFNIDLAYHLRAWQRVNVSAGLKMLGYKTYDTLVPEGRGTALEPYSQWNLMIFPSLHLNARASMRFDNDLGVAHSIITQLFWRKGNLFDLRINLKDWTEYPYLQDIRFASNHHYWINDLRNQHFTQINPVVKVKWKIPFEIEAFATRINRLIFYNRSAIPNQYLGTVVLWQMMVSSEWSSGRFSFSGKIAFQRSSDEFLVRIPDVSGEMMAGYGFSLFSGKIRATGGFILKGLTEAYLDEYMPSTRIFYQTVRAPVNSYLWADPFITFVIKKTRFMLKYEHASAWITGFGQYSLPGYPMADPAIKFAIAWRFMD